MTDPHQPGQGYPEDAPAYPQGYPTQGQPVPGQLPGSPSPFGDQQYPTQQYPAQQYGAQQYPAQQYGAQPYPAAYPPGTQPYPGQLPPGVVQAGYAPGYAPGYGYPGYPVAAPRNGMGTAALTLGILAIVFCWGVWIPWVLGALAIIFGGVGMARASAGQATNRSSAVAGLVMGIIALLLSVLFWVWLFQGWSTYN